MSVLSGMFWNRCVLTILSTASDHKPRWLEPVHAASSKFAVPRPRLASRVMCATLAIPIPPSHSKIDQMLGQDDTTLEKQRRLSTLLGLPNPPDRAALVKDLVSQVPLQDLWVLWLLLGCLKGRAVKGFAP